MKSNRYQIIIKTVQFLFTYLNVECFRGLKVANYSRVFGWLVYFYDNYVQIRNRWYKYFVHSSQLLFFTYFHGVREVFRTKLTKQKRKSHTKRHRKSLFTTHVWDVLECSSSFTSGSQPGGEDLDTVRRLYTDYETTTILLLK